RCPRQSRPPNRLRAASSAKSTSSTSGTTSCTWSTSATRRCESTRRTAASPRSDPTTEHEFAPTHPRRHAAARRRRLRFGRRRVRDRLYLSGRLEERTTDWYAQDRAGNVWYYGEATAELGKNGRVKNTEGSWQAGVDGAEPGIFMPAVPKVGQTFRQEYYKGQ